MAKHQPEIRKVLNALRKFRNCSADELGQTVIVIKAQRGIPVDDPWDSLDLD